MATQTMTVSMPDGIHDVEVVSGGDYVAGTCRGTRSGIPYESIGRVKGQEAMHVLRRVNAPADTPIAMGGDRLTFPLARNTSLFDPGWTCDKCGHDNADGAEECAGEKCKRFAEWAATQPQEGDS